MRSFARVAERGNFSAVARELGVGQATVTRHVAELEGSLGVILLNRTTRRVTLTAEGANYLVHATTILRLVEDASDAAREGGHRLAGEIRVSCTAALGIRHVQGLLFAFQDRYPEVTIDLRLSDVRIDLVSEAVDVAIRLGPLADSSMIGRKIGRSRRILVASAAYIEKHGLPQSPDDIPGHSTIRMSNVAGSETLVLRPKLGATRTIAFGGGFLVDHGLAAREALLHGRGIAPAHIWLIDDLLATDVLVPLLPEYEVDDVAVSMLIAPARARIHRVRVLIDALEEGLRRTPGIRQ